MERFKALFPQLFVGGDVAIRFVIKLLIIIALTTLVIIGLYMLTSRLKEKYLMAHIHDGPNQTKIVHMIGDSFFMICLMIVLLSAIHFLGFEITLLLAAVAFGLGFAFQDILGNTFAGLTILTNNDYALGDIIEVDHENEDYFGRIEELNMRYVVVRTVDLRRVIIPNLVMITHPVRTYEIEDTIRYEIPCTVHYTSDVQQVLQITTDAINQVTIVNKKDQTICMLAAMGDYGLEFLTYAYIDPKCGMTKKRIMGELSHAVYTALIKKDITIVYPHATLTTDYKDGEVFSSALFI